MNQKKLFHICTISNNPDQYLEMKASFLKAGFGLDTCTYSLFDNSVENKFDPYQTFNSIVNGEEEPYIIFCHQDVVLNQGDDFTSLKERLNELDTSDPTWAICGNAGVNYRYKYVVRISDPSHSPNWKGRFPQPVISLDENFLVIKSAAKIKCSPGLHGFHFYASDLCLRAVTQGHSCYAINFHLTHLSRGTLSASYWEGRTLFYSYWSSKFRFCYFKTMTGQIMCFSTSNLLRTVGSFKLIRKVLFLINRVHPFLSPH